jgi:hypothetical protein
MALAGHGAQQIAAEGQERPGVATQDHDLLRAPGQLPTLVGGPATGRRRGRRRPCEASHRATSHGRSLRPA